MVERWHIFTHMMAHLTMCATSQYKCLDTAPRGVLQSGIREALDAALTRAASGAIIGPHKETTMQYFVALSKNVAFPDSHDADHVKHHVRQVTQHIEATSYDDAMQLCRAIETTGRSCEIVVRVLTSKSKFVYLSAETIIEAADGITRTMLAAA